MEQEIDDEEQGKKEYILVIENDSSNDIRYLIVKIGTKWASVPKRFMDKTDRESKYFWLP